jgi:hypothetical protein
MATSTCRCDMKLHPHLLIERSQASIETVKLIQRLALLLRMRLHNERLSLKTLVRHVNKQRLKHCSIFEETLLSFVVELQQRSDRLTKRQHELDAVLDRCTMWSRQSSDHRADVNSLRKVIKKIDRRTDRSQQLVNLDRFNDIERYSIELFNDSFHLFGSIVNIERCLSCHEHPSADAMLCSTNKSHRASIETDLNIRVEETLSANSSLQQQDIYRYESNWDWWLVNSSEEASKTEEQQYPPIVVKKDRVPTPNRVRLAVQAIEQNGQQCEQKHTIL